MYFSYVAFSWFRVCCVKWFTDAAKPISVLPTDLSDKNLQPSGTSAEVAIGNEEDGNCLDTNQELGGTRFESDPSALSGRAMDSARATDMF